MKNKCVVLVGLSFLLTCTVVTASGDADDDQNSSPDGTTFLEETVARIKGIHDIRDVSPANLKQLLDNIDDATRIEQMDRSVDLRKYIGNIIVCLRALSSCDLGNRNEQAVISQRIVLECLSLSDALPVDSEYQLIMQIGLGPAQAIDSSGQKTTGKQWQSLRNRQLEYRLHLWRRIADQIDSHWDRKNVPVTSVMPPGGKGVGGMSPESIADPKQRTEYRAAMEKNRKKTESYNQQIRARSLRDRYLPQLKAAIGDAYAMGPVNEDDLDMLKAYLRIYVSDEKLRKEFFDIASVAAENSRTKKTKPSGK